MDLNPTLDLSVVVPVHNERDNVAPLVREIEAALAPLPLAFEIVYVDDHSRDDTLAQLRALKAAHPRLRVLHHRQQSGQSTALRTGIKAARGRWIATLDGDGQNDPADIPKLLAARDAGDPKTKLYAGWRVQSARQRQQALGEQDRQRDPLAPAAGRNPGHRLRHQAVRACGVPRPALLRPHAPLPAGAGQARRLADLERAGQPPRAHRRRRASTTTCSAPGWA
jgi:glycosyltransferase involved in cell wall biosynthesis